MRYQTSELYFIFALLAGAGVLTFFIFQPFLYALILAVIFATVFEPVHKRILAVTREKAGLAALLTTAFVLVVIVVPITFLGVQIFNEAIQLYFSLVDNGGTATLSSGIGQVMQNLGVPFLPAESLEVSQYMKQGLDWLIQNMGTVFSNVTKIMVGIFVLLVALYHLFKEGSRIKKTVIGLSPLQDVYDETIFNKLQLAINSVVRGSISIGVIQGVVAATGLAIFGVPNPVLWGSVASISALIPGFGTSLVLIPAILFLFFTGAGTAALGLLVWGILAVGLVDNVLGPKLMGRGTKLPSFLVLLSILGGVSFFGPIGLLFGPLVLSMLLAFLEIYSAIRKERSS
jgi:predicted PurR-regulated permease PerM